MMRVRELMTGLSEIPVVDENATLFEAVLEIGAARAKRAPGPAALVVDDAKRLAGFLEFGNMLMALQAGYGELVQFAAQTGLSPDAFRTALQKIGPLEDALEGLCKKAGEISIKSIMSIPAKERIIEGGVSISEAAYRMAVSGCDYLFVMDADVLEGLISLTDVMGHICYAVRECRL